MTYPFDASSKDFGDGLRGAAPGFSESKLRELSGVLSEQGFEFDPADKRHLSDLGQRARALFDDADAVGAIAMAGVSKSLEGLRKRGEGDAFPRMPIPAERVVRDKSPLTAADRSLLQDEATEGRALSDGEGRFGKRPELELAR